MAATAVTLWAPLLFGGNFKVTLAVYHDGDFERPALDAMRAETSALLREAGSNLIWKDASLPASNSIAAERLIVVRLNGACEYHPWGFGHLARKAYASVHEQHGVILPFVDVDCGKVLSSVSRLLCFEAPARAQLLFGQALGRVVAHELYHILAQTNLHTAVGVTKASLSPEELIRDPLKFDEQAIKAIKSHQPAIREVATNTLN